MSPVIVTKVKDSATGNLNAGINASVLTIALESGDGAAFPQPYTGDASSLGSRTVLNDTGALANLAVKDFIRNVTDGSWAFVVTAGTNSITTTRLQGGSDNTWESGDVWRVNEFVGTLAVIDADGNDTAVEEVLISNRSTDTLTVPTGGRGYNSTTAQAFSAADYFQLRVTAPNIEEIKGLLKELIQQLDTNTTDITTANTNITNLQTGSYHYVVATGSSNAYVAATPALAAYAAGNIVRFKANHTNTGAATINVNSLGAQAIKKLDGATALAAGDVVSGQIVELEYDGTNFQMISPIGQVANLNYSKVVVSSATSSTAVGASSTSTIYFDAGTYTIPANDLVAAVSYEFECALVVTEVAGTFDVTVNLGTTAICTFSGMGGGSTTKVLLRGVLFGTAAAGASVNVEGSAAYLAPYTNYATTVNNAAAVATNGTLLFQIGHKFNGSNAGHSAQLLSMLLKKHSTSAF